MAPSMEYRFLGRTGLKVSVMGLGSWLTYGGDVGEEKSFACMEAAYHAGINFFDTAEEYGGGNAEVLLGKAIRQFGWKQNDLVITTKLSHGVANSNRPETPLNNNGLSRKHIIEGMKYSLERLGLPYVDIVYAHRPDRCTPMDEIVRAFNHLIDTGKAFYWGTSEWTASEIADAWRVADKLGLIGPAVEQTQYNLLERQKVEGEFRWLYPAFGTGLTTFAPLKMGILTGKYNGVTKPPAGSRMAESDGMVAKHLSKTFGDDTWQQRLAVVAGLTPIAERLGCTLAQLSLAWILKNGNVSTLILGASRPDQVTENVKALEITSKLTSEVMAEIEGVVKNKPKMEPLRYG